MNNERFPLRRSFHWFREIKNKTMHLPHRKKRQGNLSQFSSIFRQNYCTKLCKHLVMAINSITRYNHVMKEQRKYFFNKGDDHLWSGGWSKEHEHCRWVRITRIYERTSLRHLKNEMLFSIYYMWQMKVSFNLANVE